MNKLQTDTALNQYVLAWLSFGFGDDPEYARQLEAVSRDFDPDAAAHVVFFDMSSLARLKYHSGTVA